MPIIPGLWKLRLETSHKFKASLASMRNSSLGIGGSLSKTQKVNDRTNAQCAVCLAYTLALALASLA